VHQAKARHHYQEARQIRPSPVSELHLKPLKYAGFLFQKKFLSVRLLSFSISRDIQLFLFLSKRRREDKVPSFYRTDFGQIQRIY